MRAPERRVWAISTNAENLPANFVVGGLCQLTALLLDAGTGCVELRPAVTHVLGTIWVQCHYNILIILSIAEKWPYVKLLT
jgi:hypothetical protein